MIIDVERIMRQRFYAWVSEYVDSENGTIEQYPPWVLICYLVENLVFTLEEIRAELDSRKIICHEGVFDIARTALQERKKT